MKWTTFLCMLVLEYNFAQNTVAFLKAPTPPAALPTYTGTGVRTTPLHIVRGMAFVQAQLNDREGRFLLDTGAPLLVLNQKPRPGQPHLKVTSLNTTFQTSGTKVKHFRWGNIMRKNVNAWSLDLSHLEELSNFSITGIIGYDILKDFEVFIDYSNAQLILLEPGNNQLHTAAEPLVSIPFELQDHLPVVAVQINNQTFHLGLDTGAGLNLLDSFCLKHLPTNLLHNNNWEEVHTIDQNEHLLKSIWLEVTQVGNLSIGKMKYALADLSNVNDGQRWQIDGVLGYPFFSQLKWSIDYVNRKIHIWEVKTR